MRKAEFVVSALFLLLACLVIYEALRLGIGWGMEGPQAGFFIFWLGIGLGACGLINLTQVLLNSGLFTGGDFLSRKSLPEVSRVFFPMVGAVLLMEFLGFYVGFLGRRCCWWCSSSI
jgi:putative tricarboxylic transport membrane protein